jgi:lipoprotein-releasing system ATP-binding protein
MNNINYPIVQCYNLCKDFGDGKKILHILNQINFTLYAGQNIAIVGESGSGKSTLLHLLGGLDRPNSGTVQIVGHTLNQLNERQLNKLRNQYIGFVYQSHHLLPEFSLLENLCMPLLIQGIKPALAKQRAWSLLAEIDLEKRAYHKPHELSGGEKQRGAVARACINNPACLLADEPTGNLDNKTARQIIRYLLSLQQTSLIIVTHDLSIAKQMDQVLSLENGCLFDITHK